MISTKDYTLIYYLTLAFVFILLILTSAFKNTNIKSIRYSKNIVLLLSVYISVFWGFRPFNIGTDTGNYLLMFKSFSNINITDFFTIVKSDYLFSSLMFLCEKLLDYRIFLFVIALFTTLSINKYINLLTCKGLKSSILFLLLYILCMFSFPSMYCNIIRNGLAVSLLLVFSYYLLNDNYKKAILWGGLGLLSHQTIFIPLGIMICISTIFRKIKLQYYYILYFLILGLSFFNIGIHQIGFLADFGIDKVNTYIVFEDTDYKIGFRIDFALFNSFFAIFFYYLNSASKQFEFYLKYYLVSSCLFFLWFHIPFSDRIGLYSWIVIPILSFLGVNERFPRKRQKYLLFMFVFLFTINLALALQ